MTWFHAIVIVLAAFRLTRLVGWDEITATIRNRVSGIPDTHYASTAKWIEDLRANGRDPWAHRDSSPSLSARRYYVAKLLHCPWCVGWWISLGVCACAYEWPHATILAAYPFAASAVVGLVAKQLDP